MRPENLQEALHATPFRPFVICLADGERIPVPHPDFIAHPPMSRVAVVVDEQERTHYIDVMLVLKLEKDRPVPAGTVAADPDGGEA